MQRLRLPSSAALGSPKNKACGRLGVWCQDGTYTDSVCCGSVWEAIAKQRWDDNHSCKTQEENRRLDSGGNANHSSKNQVSCWPLMSCRHLQPSRTGLAYSGRHQTPTPTSNQHQNMSASVSDDMCIHDLIPLVPQQTVHVPRNASPRPANNQGLDL